ncbi:MAG: hypothetical protein KC416_09705, partial [Myxococcales bacterium]|nr:hypothetical protein [Myxococcales bacterium]
MSIVASRWWIVGIVQMVVALAQGHGVLAQPKREIFESANHAATVGDLEGAIEGYLRLLDAGVHDPDV